MSRIRQSAVAESEYVASNQIGDLSNDNLWLAWQRSWRPQMRFTVQAAGKTDVGRVRANNEDNFAYDLERQIFVLCDGMGGGRAGEVASRLAVDQILAYFRSVPSMVEVQSQGQGIPDSPPLLCAAIEVANRSIYEEALENPGRTGMGTTVVALLLGEDSFSVAHLGDSRLYRVRDKVIQQLTTDHSIVMEQVRRGLLTSEEAGRSHMQNVITRALGVCDTVEPELGTHSARSGDLLLLCSDGFSRFVPEEKTLELVSESNDLQQCCESLIETAKQLGSDDNITCLLVRIVTA